MRRPAARHSEAAPRPPKHLSLFAAHGGKHPDGVGRRRRPVAAVRATAAGVGRRRQELTPRRSARRSRKAAISGAATLT